MKFRLITLAFILLIGANSYAENISADGGLSLSPQIQLTAFYDRGVKFQPGLTASAFFDVNFSSCFSTGLSAAFLYDFSSDLDGGWSYPGFSGLETSIVFRVNMPFNDSIGMGVDGTAGWYRYSLTPNLFFLPSAAVYPSLLVADTKLVRFYTEIPVRYYFHLQADFFASAGIRIRAVFK